MAIAISAALCKDDANTGINTEKIALNFFIKLFELKGAPLAFWAHVIVSASSIITGMNLNETLISVANLLIGIPILTIGNSNASIAAVSWAGVVVLVNNIEQKYNTNIRAMVTMPICKPSLETEITRKSISFSPDIKID